MDAKNTNLTEKVSVNINTSTLAAIDLLVDYGYYSSRSDFINQALRETLHRNKGNISRSSQTAGRNLSSGFWFMGFVKLTEQDEDEFLTREKPVSITGYGVLRVDEAIPWGKLCQAVGEIHVKGRVVCTPEVREHYNL